MILVDIVGSNYSWMTWIFAKYMITGLTDEQFP